MPLNRLMVAPAVLGTLLVLVVACSDDDPGAPVVTTGTLRGVVTDAVTSQPLAGVRVLPFNANTNAPAGLSAFTASDGSFAFVVPQGTYLLQFSKQDYDPSPPAGFSALPISVPAGQTITHSIQLLPNPRAGSGSLSGVVNGPGSSAAGVLVTASDSGAGYASVSDAGGAFWIYNVPAGTYSVTSWRSGFASTDSLVSVQAGTETGNITLRLTAGTPGSVSGQITFLASRNAEVDVSLLDPLTELTVPGLTAMTANRRYTITNVPDGVYLARATYRNDSIVVDPDWIIKNGEPYVTVSGGGTTRDFSLTDAVELSSPTNPVGDTQPVEIDTTSPVFQWLAYPSAKDYVIEVIDEAGRVIWGGFSNNWTVKNIAVTGVSVRWNSDGGAVDSLRAGRTYRWKIYASKDDSREPTGWKLISASEDQRGLIRVRR